MYTAKTKLVAEGVPPEPVPALPASTLESVRKSEGSELKVQGPLFTSPSRVAVEHSYAKLVPFRSSHCTGNKDSSFATVVLFADKMGVKHKKKSLKGKRRFKQSIARQICMEELQSSHGEVSTEEGEFTAVQVAMEVEPR